MTTAPRFFTSLWQDLRFAARMIAKRPGFSAAIVLTVAVGIGANTALFSVVRAVLLRPLGYTNPQQLVILSDGATPIHVDELRRRPLLHRHRRLLLRGRNGPHRRRASPRSSTRSASPPTSSTSWASRLRSAVPFSPQKTAPAAPMSSCSAPACGVASSAANPAIVGHAITLAGKPYTVVGILPPRFDFPSADGTLDVWTTRPLEWSPMPVKSRPLSPYLHVFGRLKPGISIEQASDELAVLNRQYATAHPAMLDARPETLAGRPRIDSLQQSVVSDVREPLLLLTGAVGLLLLIVCANVASLLLARAATRARELAVRAALGAGRGRLLRQLLTESTLLSLIGGALGTLLAWTALRGIRTATASPSPAVRRFASTPPFSPSRSRSPSSPASSSASRPRSPHFVAISPPSCKATAPCPAPAASAAISPAVPAVFSLPGR